MHLQFLDHPYRGPESFSGLLRDEIERIADGFDEVWLPAGIGGHPDHVAIAQLIHRLRGGFELFVYAELPYAQHEWGIRNKASSEKDAPTLEDILRTCQSGPYIQPTAVALSERQIECKRLCLQQYASQLQGIHLSFSCWSPDNLDRAEWFWRVGPAPERLPPIDLMYQTLGLAPVGNPPAPSFTVVMRTQGRRQRELTEALASLAAQTCRQFDVVVLYHNTDETHAGSVRAAIDALPGWLAENTRLIRVQGGDRGRPLNVGLNHRRGDYVVFLDDDDCARANWLAEFARMAGHHPGMVLRARVAEVHIGSDETTQLFPADYDFLTHLESNWTPLNSVAIPLYKYPQGLAFHEALPVVEDWDFLLRAVELFGVACSAEVTAEYRRWPEGSNSRDAIAPVAWQAAEQCVRARADARYVLAPPGSASTIRSLRHQAARLHASQDLLRIEAEKTALLTAENEALTTVLGATTDQLGATTARLSLLQAQLQAIESSRSWRLTRWLLRVARPWLWRRQ